MSAEPDLPPHHPALEACPCSDPVSSRTLLWTCAELLVCSENRSGCCHNTSCNSAIVRYDVPESFKDGALPAFQSVIPDCPNFTMCSTRFVSRSHMFVQKLYVLVVV